MLSYTEIENAPLTSASYLSCMMYVDSAMKVTQMSLEVVIIIGLTVS